MRKWNQMEGSDGVFLQHTALICGRKGTHKPALLMERVPSNAVERVMTSWNVSGLLMTCTRTQLREHAPAGCVLRLLRVELLQ